MERAANLSVAPNKKICKCCGRELSISEFCTTRLGVMNTCRSCVRQNQIKAKNEKKIAKMRGDEVTEARTMRLEDFTPRQLMERLRDLGYKGELTYTRVEKINLSKL